MVIYDFCLNYLTQLNYEKWYQIMHLYNSVKCFLGEVQGRLFK